MSKDKTGPGPRYMDIVIRADMHTGQLTVTAPLTNRNDKRVTIDVLLRTIAFCLDVNEQKTIIEAPAGGIIPVPPNGEVH